MPYITTLDGALIEVGVDGGNIVTLPPTTVLNDFGSSTQFDQYEVQDDSSGAETVVEGDYIAPIVNGTPQEGTYLGSGPWRTRGLRSVTRPEAC